MNEVDRTRTSRSIDTRTLVAVGIVGLIVAFALANSQRVEVDFLVVSADARLIVVIGASALLGAIADRLLVRRRRHPEHKDS